MIARKMPNVKRKEKKTELMMIGSQDEDEERRKMDGERKGRWRDKMNGVPAREANHVTIG